VTLLVVAVTLALAVVRGAVTASISLAPGEQVLLKLYQDGQLITQRAVEAAEDAVNVVMGKNRRWTDLEKAFVLDIGDRGGYLPGMRTTLVTYLKLQFPATFSKLKESNVRYWEEVRKKAASVVPKPKWGRRSLLQPATIEACAAMIQGQVSAGLELDSTILRPMLEGVIVGVGQGEVLECQGGPHQLSKSWINKLCVNLGYSMRKATTAAQKLPGDWEAQVLTMNHRVAYLVGMYEIPKALVVNWDQTGLHLVSSRGIGRGTKGASEIAFIGGDDKRQFTAVFAGAADGTFLPVQMIFQGKTPACLPKSHKTPEFKEEFAGWHLTFTENHWSNQEAMKQYIIYIIHPYFSAAKSAAGLASDHKCIVLIDCWKVHKSREFRDWLKLEYPYMIPLFVPAGTTGKAQVMDVVVNRAVKHVIRHETTLHFSHETQQQVANGVRYQDIRLDTKLSTLKPRLPHWVKAGWERVRNDPALLIKGWDKVGTSMAWDPAFQVEANRVQERTGSLFQRLPSGVDLWGDHLEGDEPEPIADDVYDIIEGEQELEEDAGAGTLQGLFDLGEQLGQEVAKEFLFQEGVKLAAKGAAAIASGVAAVAGTVKRGRGRPKGSKNKPKPAGWQPKGKGKKRDRSESPELSANEVFEEPKLEERDEGIDSDTSMGDDLPLAMMASTSRSKK
jgi:hypothetical protein